VASGGRRGTKLAKRASDRSESCAGSAGIVAETRLDEGNKSYAVDHGGGACDDTQTFGVKLTQIRDRLLRQTIAQEFLLGVVAQILTSSHAVFILADLVTAVTLSVCFLGVRSDSKAPKPGCRTPRYLSSDERRVDNPESLETTSPRVRAPSFVGQTAHPNEAFSDIHRTPAAP
jgi:hypothetical protein